MDPLRPDLLESPPVGADPGLPDQEERYPSKQRRGGLRYLLRPLLGGAILAGAFLFLQASGVAKDIPGIGTPGIGVPQQALACGGTMSVHDYWVASNAVPGSGAPAYPRYTTSGTVTWYAQISGSWCYAYHFVSFNGGASWYSTSAPSGGGWVTVLANITVPSDGSPNTTLGNALRYKSCTGAGQTGCGTAATGAMDDSGVIVDRQKPNTPSVTYPTSTLFTNSSSGTVTWSTVSDNGSAGISYYAINAHWATPDGAGGCTSQQGDSGWAWAVSGTSWSPAWGANTCFQFQVSSVDNAGNQSNGSAWSAWVIMDNVSPTANGYLNATCFIPGQTVTITQSGSSDPVPSSGWNWGGSGILYYFNNWLNPTGWINSNSYSYAVPTPTAGTQASDQAQLYIRDAVGTAVNNGTNQSNAFTLNYSVDNTSPTGAGASGYPSYTKSATISFTPSATAGGCAGIGAVQISNNGITWAAGYSNGTLVSGWDITNASYGGTSAQGSHTVYVRFQEGASANWTTASFTVTYDTVAPTLSWIYPPVGLLDYARHDLYGSNPSCDNNGAGCSSTGINDGNETTAGGLYFLYGPGWFEVDLLSARTINSVRVLTSNNIHGDQYGTSTVTVAYSNDNVSWAAVSTGVHTMTSADNTWSFTPVSARYWRITDESKDFWEKWQVLTFSTFGSSAGLTDTNNPSSFNFAWTDADATSGIASRTAKLYTGIASNNTCGSWNAGVDVSVSGSGPYAAASGTPTSGSCYYLAVTLTDAVGNSATYTSSSILVDTTAPTTPMVTSSGTNAYEPSSVGPNYIIYFNNSAAGSVDITTTSSDPESGIASVGFSAFTTGGTGWLPNTGGAQTGSSYTRTYTWSSGSNDSTMNSDANNNAGLTSSAARVEMIPDASGPTGSLLINGGATYTTSVSVALTTSATDTGSGIYQMRFSSDGSNWGGWVTYATSYPWTLTSGDGVKTVYVEYIDRVGNIGSPYNDSILLDSVTPATSVTCAGATCVSWYSGAVTVALSAYDATSGVASTYYTIDGGVTTPYVGSFSISANAMHSLHYWSVDVAGNVEGTNSLGIGVDSSAPIVTFACTGTPGAGFSAHACTASNWFVASPVSVAMSASDTLAPVTNFVYSVDGGSNSAYGGSFGVNDEGMHTVFYQATNAAGWTTGGVIFIDIDTSAPTVTAGISPSSPDGLNGWYTSDPVITLSAVDSVSGLGGIFYTVDGGTPTAYTTPIGVPEGTHTVLYWATDVASNSSSHTGFGQTRVDTVRPVATFVANTYDPVHDTTIPLDVTSHDVTSGTSNGSIRFSSDGGLTWADWLNLDSSGNYSGSMAVPSGDTLFAIEMQVRDLAGNISDPITGPAPRSVFDVPPTLAIDMGISPLAADGSCSTTIYWSTTNTITWPTEQGFCLIERFDAANGVIGTNGGLDAIMLPLDYYTTYQVMALANNTYLSGPASTARTPYYTSGGAINGMAFTPVHETIGNGVSVNVVITTMVAFYLPGDLDSNGVPLPGKHPVKLTPVAFPISGQVIILNSGTLTGTATP